MKKAFFLFFSLLLPVFLFSSCEEKPDMQTLLSFEQSDYTLTAEVSGSAPVLLKAEKKGDILTVTPVEAENVSGVSFAYEKGAFYIQTGSVRTEIKNTSLCYPALLCVLLSADPASLWKIAEYSEGGTVFYRCTGELGTYYFNKETKNPERIETEEAVYRILSRK